MLRVGGIMQCLTSMKELDKEVLENPMLLAYSSGGKCSVCTVLKGKVKIMMHKYPKMKAVEIDGDKNPEITSQLSIFTLPSIIIYINGKEALREARNISLELLDEKIERLYRLMYT